MHPALCVRYMAHEQTRSALRLQPVLRPFTLTVGTALERRGTDRQTDRQHPRKGTCRAPVSPNTLSVPGVIFTARGEGLRGFQSEQEL